MAKNDNLHKAKDAKNDEFYTRIEDVAEELRHYKKHFAGKVVFCNCDDPTWSAFWRYFHLNFAELGLKKLISTHYDRTEPTYKMEYEGGDDNNVEVGVKTPLEGNGDFRNKECLDLLDECDIVVTNPPFSLFREYVAVLMQHQKKFLILGNMNALTYKEIFPLIRDNQLWYGASIHSGDRKFYVPNDYPLKASGCGVDNNGQKFIRVKGVRWYTNLDYKARHEKLVLWKNYTPEEYPKYDNYDAINVNKYSEIPCDYDGVMGVPITFIDYYCPEQFEIVALVLSKSEKEALVQFVAQLYLRNKSIYQKMCNSLKCQSDGSGNDWKRFMDSFLKQAYNRTIISTNDGEHEEFQTKDLCKYLNTLCYQFCYTRETFITSNVPVTIFSVKNKNVLEVWVPLASHVGVLFSSKNGHSGNNRLIDHTQSTEELNRRMYWAPIAAHSSSILLIASKDKVLRELYQNASTEFQKI